MFMLISLITVTCCITYAFNANCRPNLAQAKHDIIMNAKIIPEQLHYHQESNTLQPMLRK